MRKSLYIYIILQFTYFLVFAQAPRLKFDMIGTEQGLSDNFVEAILQDKDGFLWFGTDNGLYRFNGFDCKRYNHDENDETSIHDNFIYRIFQDSKDRMWIIYRFTGMSVYNRNRDNFTTLSFKDSNSTDSLLKNSIRDIYEDFDHNIWILNAYGVACLQSKDSTWKWYTQSLDSLPFKNKYSFSMTQLKDSTILLGLWNYGNPFAYNKKKDGFKQLNIHPVSSHYSKGKSISCITQDYEGFIWIGTIESGLLRYDIKTGAFKQYLNNRELNNSLITSEILFIFEDSKKALWVSTVNGGLFLYDRKNDTFFNYKSVESEPYSLQSNTITKIIEDDRGNLWMSSHGGVFCLNYSKNLFAFFGKSTIAKGNFDGKRVACFYEAKNGQIWVGTDGHGLYLYSRETGFFKKYTLENGLSSNSILDIVPNGDGKLWIATWGGGICLFDPDTEKFTKFLASEKENNLNNPNVKGLLKDGDLLWIATHGRGLVIYDMKEKQFYNKDSKNNKFSFDLGEPTWGNSVKKDSDGNIWILSTLGLYKYDGKTLSHFYSLKDDINSLSSSNVNVFYEDKNGVIWIGSSGLDMYRKETSDFVRLNRLIPELPESIRSITSDSNGKLWLGTKNGLYLFNPKDSSVKQFTIEDGLQGNQFIDRAIQTTKKGEILIGGNNGFNIFNPDKIKTDTLQPKLHIYSCLIWEENTQKNLLFSFPYLNKNNSISIPYENRKLVTIEYSGVSYFAPSRIKYSYNLAGLDDTWRNVGNERKVSFTNLKPGEYTFWVKAVNKDGVWNNDGAKITFIIETPWWQTIWFKLLLLLTLVSIIFVSIYLRIRNIKKYNKILQQTVTERTHELEESNLELEEQRLEVISQNNKLKENQLVIKLRNEELNETLRMKDKLMSIIAHDLKNPLNSIIGFIQLLKNLDFKNDDGNKASNYIALIGKSSLKLHNQLNNLLDWAGTLSNEIKIRQENINLSLLTKDVISLLSDSAYSKEININVESNSHSYAFADSRMISTVLRNLVSNSIKFTPRGGSITIILDEDNEKVLLSIKDTGVGMTDDQLNKLFIKDSQITTLGTEQEIGTGLGLKISKEFIEANKGDIFVSSIKDNGSLFTIVLPKGEKIKATKEIENISVSDYTTNDKTILIIDDNYEIVEMISAIFDNSYKIETAYNGKDGFFRAKLIMPDIIISDINMPEMDGKQMCVALKKEHITSHIPIIFITAESGQEEIINSFELGAYDYITKPFNKEVLRRKVDALLENRQEYRNYLKREVLITPLQEIKTESKDEILLKQVNELVEAHLRTPDLSVEFLAREIGVSRAQLFRKFKAILGYSPVEYIRMYRLQRAVQMLETGRYRISEVAYDVGFSDPKYFSTCFSKQFGKTPSEFLKEK